MYLSPGPQPRAYFDRPVILAQYVVESVFAAITIMNFKPRKHAQDANFKLPRHGGSVLDFNSRKHNSEARCSVYLVIILRHGNKNR